DLANTRTLAQHGPDGVYRLSGRKSFATFGRDADYYLCAARRTETVTGQHKGVVDGFFVARPAAGLTGDGKWGPRGRRPEASVGRRRGGGEAGDVVVSGGGGGGVGARHWSTVLFAAVFLGVGEGALREGLKQVGPDAVWARATLAEKALALDAAAGYLESVAASADGWPLPREARERTQRCKTFIARTAVEAATHVAMISGGRC